MNKVAGNEIMELFGLYKTFLLGKILYHLTYMINKVYIISATTYPYEVHECGYWHYKQNISYLQLVNKMPLDQDCWNFYLMPQ